MASITDDGVKALLESRNHAIVSTFNDDGSIHSTVVWANVEEGKVAVNSAVGRKWPTNLAHDAHVTVVVYNESNPYEYVEIRGIAASSTEDADGHIDRLTRKYLGAESYPFRQPGEQRIRFLVAPTLIRYHKQG